MMTPNSPEARDAAYHLHSNTNARKLEADGPRVLSRGQGIYVYDEEGKAYIEGLSGLWCAAVGFNHERLVRAAAEQMAALPYYHTFSQKAHPPVIDLAEKLSLMTPSSVSRVYFTNSGSEANDTVVKMVWYYNNALGRPEKKKFLSRKLAYHGITVASGSLTGVPANHVDFDLPAIPVRHLTTPHFYRQAQPGEDEAAFTERLAREAEDAILEEGPETVAAFIGEPVMGAGGVMPPPAGYWPALQAVCRKYDVLLVADEVITGFGRTGTRFACERYGIEPDMLVLSKQLTSAYLPMAAVVFSDAMYQVIADASARNGVFGTGFTASGHPVAAAVALENLRILEEERLVENAAVLGPYFQQRLQSLAQHPLVGEARGVGLIGALELVADKAQGTPFDPMGKMGLYVFERGHEHGLITRAIRDTIALCPPLIITRAQIDDVMDRLKLMLDDGLEFAVREGMMA